MPRNEIFAEDFVYDEFAYLDYTRSDNTNREERRKMKIILSKAVLEELTELQRICLTEYYLKGRKKKDIAKQIFSARKPETRRNRLDKLVQDARNNS